MKVTRRDFIKYCVGSAAALGLEMSVLGALEKSLAAGSGPPIIWLNGASCSGCTVSLANRFSATSPTNLGDLLINTVNLAYHPTLMAAAGATAVSALTTASSGKFILAVEGGIPTAFGGGACIVYTQGGTEVTALAAVKALAAKASAVISVGTCASFGGIPSGKPNPTSIQSVKTVTGKTTINVPGCPVHPDWVVWTIAQLLAGVSPALDSSGRPTALYGKTVHSQCPRQDTTWATTLGQDGLCLRGLCCKGPNVKADCPTRKWNSATNWCVGANAMCLGCTESGFPDKFSPFFTVAGALPSGHESVSANATCNSCHKNGNFDD